MATKKAQLPARRQTNEVPQKLKFAIAGLIDPKTQQDEFSEEIMQEFGEFEIEKFGGLNPVVNFEHPGDTFIGDYIGSREINFDGRVSRLYNFRADPKFAGRDDMIVSVWGSAVLDRIFLDVSPQMDDKIVIQYAGLGANAKKGNPPKLFNVGRLNKK